MIIQLDANVADDVFLVMLINPHCTCHSREAGDGGEGVSNKSKSRYSQRLVATLATTVSLESATLATALATATTESNSKVQRRQRECYVHVVVRCVVAFCVGCPDVVISTDWLSHWNDNRLQR